MHEKPYLSPEQRLLAVKRQLGIPAIVVICGSTRFMQEMAEADLHETAAGRVVVRPGCNMKEPHPLWADPVQAGTLKDRLDNLHRAKIRLADEVLIVGNYIGESTRNEIDYARSLGKPVRFTHPKTDPSPDPLPATTYEISLHGSATNVAVQAVEPVPGLHVYRLPEALCGPDDATHPWRLGHHSGLALVAAPSHDDAMRAAREIADMTDWSRSAPDLVSGDSFDLDDYIDRLTERTNILFIPAGPAQCAPSTDEPPVQS